MSPSASPDILLVSLGTTLGWRHTDRVFVEQIRSAGVSVEAISVGFGLATRLRRGYPVNDLVEMHAVRRATRAGVERLRPRALIVSTTTAAMLLPKLDVPYGGPTGRARAHEPPGASNAPLHALERRGLARATLVLPLSEAARAELPEGAAPAVVVSPPIEASGPSARGERERVAVAYVPDPKAKGLDILVAGWSAAAVPEARLEVYGLAPETARAHLRRTGVPEPATLDLKGTVPAAEFRAQMRHAHVYAAGARWEDFGQAPLEALADGALVATVPSGGPFEALRIARQLEPELVASRIDGAALAPAIRAAFALGPERVDAYRGRVGELLRPLRAEVVQRTVAEQVLPRLLR